MHMTRFWIVILAMFALALMAMPASAMRWIDTSGLTYPGAPKRATEEEKPKPYPMNYAEEAAESLGFRDGHMDVFQTRPMGRNTMAPTLSGGVGGDGAMLKLQWHPGE